MRQRVAITGMGVVSPLGNQIEVMWNRALAGESALAAHTYTNAATGHTLTIPSASVPPGTIRSLDKTREILTDKFGRIALIAGADAIEAARLDFTVEDLSRCGTSTGTCMSGISETEVGFNSIYVKKHRRVHPFTVIRTMANSPCAWLSIDHHLTGPSLSFANTCAASSVAIGEAALKIRYGIADIMIAGGTETLLTYSAVNCWDSAQLLAPVHAVPAQSCRPFDATRNGTALGEGAVYVVLEEWEHALRRNAPIVAELVGYACTTDSVHVTQPSVEGQMLSMQQAVADAQIPPERIGYICAHGTGTKLNDVTETQAIKKVFGTHAHSLAVSSPKSMVGHLVGAAGAFSLVLCVLALRDRRVPPTANLYHPDPECDLDYVPLKGRDAPMLEGALCNAFGFGGTSACLAVTHPH